MSDCSHHRPSKPSDPQESVPHCHAENSGIDWLLWGSSLAVVSFYLAQPLLTGVPSIAPHWITTASITVYELINTMWWSMLLAILFVGLLGKIPQSFVIAVLGTGGTWRGLWRAALAGVLMDLCSHGILMVGMQLYRRGASLGQVMAFLIASPWNSLSLTIILVALIGVGWTIIFVLLSLVIALISGRIFDQLVTSGRLPDRGISSDPPSDFRFWREAYSGLRELEVTPAWITGMIWQGVKGSRMVLRWLLFGVMLAACIQAFIDTQSYQRLFAPTITGLGLTLVAATIIEVCSEGSAPIAADLIRRAQAPGNSFAFLMAGVSTDYTEIMSIKDTSGSWRIALFLPLVTLPQIIVFGWLLNQAG